MSELPTNERSLTSKYPSSTSVVSPQNKLPWTPTKTPELIPLYIYTCVSYHIHIWQIDDILKAAIQDAGLEFFNAAATYSSPDSIDSSSESSLNQFSLDDDFTLTDLDWNLLDQSSGESPLQSTTSSSISPIAYNRDA